jgi:uncharacterized membrane protein
MDSAVISLIFLLIGVFFALFGVPLKQEKVPPNWFYGFRTRKTLSNEKIWYEVNKVTGIDMIRAGVVISAAALFILALRNKVTPETAAYFLVTVSLIMVGWMAIHGFSILRRL